MSKLYGTLVGARGPATRCGTKASGIRAAVQSYDGSCITTLNYNSTDQLILSIDTAEDSRDCWGNRKYYGTIEKFNELMSVVNSIGIDKAISILKNS